MAGRIPKSSSRIPYSDSAVHSLRRWSVKLEQYGPPAGGPSRWDLGPGHGWAPCERQRLRGLDFHPGWWAAQGRPALSLRFLCPAAVLPFVLPGSSPAPPSTPSTFHMSFMSCRGPWAVLPPQHIPEALPFHFLGGHCPGQSLDSSPLAVVPETLPQLLFLLTAAWGLRQTRENVSKALQKPETLQPADLAQAHLPPAPCAPRLYQSGSEAWLVSGPFPTKRRASISEGGLPALCGCLSPRLLPLPLVLRAQPSGLQRWSQHRASYFLPFPGPSSWRASLH